MSDGQARRTSQDTAYVVMTDPPETRCSYARQVWETKEGAEKAAEDVSFGYVTEVKTMSSEDHTARTTRTEYTIWHDDGTPRMYTDSANVAEAHARIGLRVTAVTTAQ